MRLPVILRWYRYWCRVPYFRGKSRVDALVRKFVRFPQRRIEESTSWGGRIILDLSQEVDRGLFLYGDFYERETVEMLRSLLKIGDSFVDGGAHIGYYTLLASSLIGPSGRVFAFEPSPSTFSRLLRNAELNNLMRATLLPYALGDREVSSTIFRLNPENAGMDSLSPGNDEIAEKASCAVVTLDGLLASGLMVPPQVIKLDVEGSEMNALRGAERLLSGHAPPAVIFEINPSVEARFGYQPQDLLTFLRRTNDYTIFWLSQGGLQEVKVDAELPHCRVHGKNFGANYLAIHQSRTAELPGYRQRGSPC